MKHWMVAGAGATPTQAAESDASALAAKLKGWAGSSKSASKESVTAKFKLSTVNDKKTGAACQKVGWLSWFLGCLLSVLG